MREFAWFIVFGSGLISGKIVDVLTGQTPVAERQHLRAEAIAAGVAYRTVDQETGEVSFHWGCQKCSNAEEGGDAE